MMERRGFFKTILAAFAAVPLAKVFVWKAQQPGPTSVSLGRDDTPWIQAAIDRCAKSGEDFVLPPGTYFITDITLGRSPFVIRGSTFYFKRSGLRVTRWPEGSEIVGNTLIGDADPDDAAIDLRPASAALSVPGWTA